MIVSSGAVPLLKPAKPVAAFIEGVARPPVARQCDPLRRLPRCRAGVADDGRCSHAKIDLDMAVGSIMASTG